MPWKKGRGKLGPLAPLIGDWEATTDSPRGPVQCVRTFEQVLGEKYIQLKTTWRFAKGAYEELALFGADKGVLTCWACTSDGRKSTGVLASAPDIHKEAIRFQARMPAGVARQIYWPSAEGGFNWAVESKNKKGWHRFVEHHYRAAK